MPPPRERISVTRKVRELQQRMGQEHMEQRRMGLPHMPPRLRTLLPVAMRHQPVMRRRPLTQLPPATPRPRMLPRLNQPTLDMHPAAKQRLPHTPPRMAKAAVTKNNGFAFISSGSQTRT
jgi:hypothetical protein